MVGFVLVSLGRRRPVFILAHAAGLSLLCVGLRLGLMYAFASNPGSAFNSRAFRNWPLFVDLVTLRPSPSAFAMMSFCGFLWVLVPLRWQQQPRFFRRLVLVVPLVLASMFWVANLDELRIYNEVTAILAPVAVIALRNFFSESPRAA